jgi:hypothetical protein
MKGEPQPRTTGNRREPMGEPPPFNPDFDLITYLEAPARPEVLGPARLRKRSWLRRLLG